MRQCHGQNTYPSGNTFNAPNLPELLPALSVALFLAVQLRHGPHVLLIHSPHPRCNVVDLKDLETVGYFIDQVFQDRGVRPGSGAQVALSALQFRVCGDWPRKLGSFKQAVCVSTYTHTHAKRSFPK